MYYLVQPDMDTVCTRLRHIFLRGSVSIPFPPIATAKSSTIAEENGYPSGLPTADAFDLGIGQYAMAGVATILSMGILERVGRRTLWLAGLAGMLLPVLCIGILSLVPNQTLAIIWCQGVLVLVRFFAYGISCGPIPFVYCGEISSVKLRQKVRAHDIIIT